MSKNKIWKAEKQEDLAYYGESDRIKFLFAHTLKKIKTVLCFTNEDAQTVFNNYDKLSADEKGKTLKLIGILSTLNVEEVHYVGTPTNKFVECLSSETLQILISSFSKYHSDEATFFIVALTGLFQCFENRASMNAANAQVHRKQLRRAWREQRRYKEEIRGLRNELYGLQMATKARVAAKKRLIRQQEHEIVEIRNKCHEEIATMCAESEVHMEKACVSSQDRQEELERELIGAQSTLDELHTSHQSTEKSLRAEKRAAEEALEQVIAQYDDTMFQLHAEVEGTEEGYLDELQQLQLLQSKFEVQEVLYVAAMLEKEEEEREELEAKILLFRRRLAACKIQTFWRSYLQRKQERSKGKKGKKGRKKQPASEKKKQAA